MKYKVLTTFDNSIAYCSDKEMADDHVKEQVAKTKRNPNQYIITKL